MNKSSVLSKKGRITIPQEIRKRLGLAPGDLVEFVIEGDRTVLRRASSETNYFDKFIGILEPFPGGEAGIKSWIDDMRSDKDYE